jgi:hypothetical protein
MSKNRRSMPSQCSYGGLWLLAPQLPRPPNLFSILKRAALQIFTGRRKHSFSTVSARSRRFDW